jgi:hypothetical protein
VGTTPGAHDIRYGGRHTDTFISVSGIPFNGAPIYVRLYTIYGNTLEYIDYTYTAAAEATMITPAPSSTFTGLSQTFNWNGATNATGYSLNLGTTGPGSYDLYFGGLHTSTSLTVNGLPSNGETIYARLFTSYNGTLGFVDYTYNATAPATMTTPIPSTQFGGTSQTFNWSTASGATGYALWLGTTGPGSNDLFYGGLHPTTSVTVNGLPTGGQTIYARLYTNYNGVLESIDYTYTSAP